MRALSGGLCMIREFSIQACSVWERWRSCPGTRAPAPGMPCPIAIGATPLQSSLSRSRRRRRRVRCGAVPGACTGELTGTMGFFFFGRVRRQKRGAGTPPRSRRGCRTRTCAHRGNRTRARPGPGRFFLPVPGPDLPVRCLDRAWNVR